MCLEFELSCVDTLGASGILGDEEERWLNRSPQSLFLSDTVLLLEATLAKQVIIFEEIILFRLRHVLGLTNFVSTYCPLTKVSRILFCYLVLILPHITLTHQH